ncbi:MAG: large subunit ribosomal protein [Thermotogota bacterium]|nr:large subunit ribosomal protein [Thermotogota bacterium]MDK2864401.1 large subunit ribosomal protein [Thermotogota bacterium]
MYAVVETSGRQYRVVEGEVVYTELQRGYNPGDEIVFDKVLLVRKDGEVLVGKPYVEGAKVSGVVVEHVRGPKLITIKFRPRKNSRKKIGHRQWYTAVKIEKIEA